MTAQRTRSLVAVIEELSMRALPAGGQRTARRNAWAATAELRVRRLERQAVETWLADPARRPRRTG